MREERGHEGTFLVIPSLKISLTLEFFLKGVFNSLVMDLSKPVYLYCLHGYQVKPCMLLF